MKIRSSDKGSAIITVLVFLTITVLLISFLVLHRYMQSKLIINYEQKIQTNLNSKSIVFYFLQNYQHKVNSKIYDPATFDKNLFGNDSSTVTYKPWGLLIEATGTSKIGKTRAERQFLISRSPTQVFQAAIVMGNTRNPLVVSGTTGILGDIYVGPQGIKSGTLRGRRFKGTTLVKGKVNKSSASQMPDIEIDMLEYQKRQLRITMTSNLSISEANISDTRLILENYTYVCSQSELDELMKTNYRTIVGPGKIIFPESVSVNGLNFENRITIYSEQSLSLNASGINHSLVFARSLKMQNTQASGSQFFATDNMSITGTGDLDYNCIAGLFSNIPWKDQENFIINGNVLFQGTVIMINTAVDSDKRSYRLKIEDNAKVRGLIYTPHYTHLSGNVDGTVMTNYFYFYKSPSSYINWLYDVLIDRMVFSENFVIPVGMKTASDLHIYREL